VLMLSMSAWGVIAQPYPNSGAQSVCITNVAEPYGTINTVGSTYVWKVDGTTTSAKWVLTTTGTNLATVLWITPGIYTVQVLETNAAGCANPLPVEVVVTVNPKPTLTIHDPAVACAPSTVDLTAAGVTAGSTLEGGALSYWTDAAATVALASPNAVTVSGTYYIKVTTASGCTDIKSVTVVVSPKPVLTTHDPVAVCAPSTVDLTAAGVTAGSTLEGGALSYWTDAAATLALAGSNAVTVSGTYYIKVTTTSGCTDIKAVTVTVNPKPVLTIHDPAVACAPSTVDLTAAGVTAGSTLEGGALSYWTDAAATLALAGSNAVTVSGTYYIKVTTASGCTDIKSVTVTVSPKPVLTTHNPAAVCSPSTVDLTAAGVTAGSTLEGGALSYWTDAAATAALAGSNAVTVSGTYYIKVTTASGCTDIKSVTVTVNPLPTTSPIFHN